MSDTYWIMYCYKFKVDDEFPDLNVYEYKLSKAGKIMPYICVIFHLALVWNSHKFQCWVMFS